MVPVPPGWACPAEPSICGVVAADTLLACSAMQRARSGRKQRAGPGGPGGDAAATPVMALTADTFPVQHESYRAAGMSEVLTKPSSGANLLDALVDAGASGRPS